jgi:N-acetyl-gamma-glutamylphosphate reductase
VTGPATDEPIAGYDGLTTRALIGSLSSRSQTELAAIDSYERAHRKRKAVFGKLRVLRDGDRQVREHTALSTDQVVAALRRLRARGIAPVAGDAKR